MERGFLPKGPLPVRPFQLNDSAPSEWYFSTLDAGRTRLRSNRVPPSKKHRACGRLADVYDELPRFALYGCRPAFLLLGPSDFSLRFLSGTRATWLAFRGLRCAVRWMTRPKSSTAKFYASFSHTSATLAPSIQRHPGNLERDQVGGQRRGSRHMEIGTPDAPTCIRCHKSANLEQAVYSL